MLNQPNLVDKIADLINKTRTAQEMEPSTSTQAQESINGLTTELDNILSRTQNDPSFDEIMNEILSQHLMTYPEQQESEVQTSTSSEQQANEAIAVPTEEVPIKQRLRPRCERNNPATERKKKITIISNEPYTGVVPAVANLLPMSSVLPAQAEITQSSEMPPQVILNLPMFMQTGLEMIPVLNSVPSTSLTIVKTATVPNEALVTSSSMTNSSIVQPSSVPTPIVLNEVENKEQTEAEKKETTPKVTLYPAFLETRCKSTPRRKHVRILDFTQTPSIRRLSTVKEFSTPNSGIPLSTPGSAPASVSLCKMAKKVQAATAVQEIKTQEIAENVIDDNSNSNSISNTPKVAKNRRRRKIAEAKSEEKKPVEEELNKPFTIDDWANLRNQAKKLQIDQQVRLLNVQAEKKGRGSTKKRRPFKRRTTTVKEQSAKKKSPTKTPEENNKSKIKKVKTTIVSPENSTSTEIDENKPLSTMRFKIASPRKIAALKNTPKKKKKSIVERSKEKFEAHEAQKKKKDDAKAAKKDQEAEKDEPTVPSELNRSDTVQEVATMLTTLSETILAKDSSAKGVEADTEAEAKEHTDSGIEPNPVLETPIKELTETPFKDISLTPLPNTPRFAIPLMSSSQETPMPKIFATTASTLASIVKNCDILTPSFAITPGFKETPWKDGVDGSPASASGYSSRRTDYSSCSSYYKPDESEEINQNLNAFVNQRRSERNSQSESDGGCTKVIVDKPSKLMLSVKKVECPGAIERVKSFNEEQKAIPAPHYTMMDEGLLSESIVTTATDDSSNSSSSSSDFTCSTCSTDSTDETTMAKLNKATKTEEKDSEWDCDGQEIAKDELVSPAVMNEKTGEVRFPLRNWITPKKVEVDQAQVKIDETNKIKSLLNANDPRRGLSIQEEREKLMREMKEKKQRTLDILRSESTEWKSKTTPKFKKTNVKCFKLPAHDGPRPTVFSRKDQILSQNLTERPRPTPLKLIPASSSRRKNATPRKTIVIDELPRQPSPIKKKKAAKPSTPVKSRPEQISMESVTDNAVTPEEALGLDMSCSFNTSNEEETSSTVVANKLPVKPVATEEGSNTFQRTLIEQGFDKIEAKELQSELVDKLEDVEQVPVVDVVPVTNVLDVQTEVVAPPNDATSPANASLPVGTVESFEETEEEKATANSSNEESGSEYDDESDEELEAFSTDANEKNCFFFMEPENAQPATESLHKPTIPPMILRIDERTIMLTDTGDIDLFTMKPEPVKVKKSPKKAATDDKKNGKESPSKNGKSKTTKKSNFRWDQSKTLQSKTSSEK